MNVTLDNGYITTMAANGTLLAEFPFLGLFVEQRACCGRVCGRHPDFDGIRANIMGLSDEQKTKLKTMLGADEVSLHYNDGKAVQLVKF
jgi:hypothetical protein